MEKKDGTKVTKTTVKVWRPLVAKLEARMNEACLRRDLYLARLLASEVQHLDAEVAIANSPSAYNHVFDRLETLERKPVSLALPPELVEKINDVCKRKYIVRDAFFNRIFLLLAASPKNLDTILFPTYHGDWKRDVWREYGNESNTIDLGVLPLASLIDPFWAIREGFLLNLRNLELIDYKDPVSCKKIKLIKDDQGNITLPENIYTKYLSLKVGDNDLTGMNCYIPDFLITENSTQCKRDEEIEEMKNLI